ncbi:Riboflavin kinase [Trichoderma ghanense]|uniref:Riboflavin kinase n=1 Tax=Trichoderma ghanense TaxID=65468 RepID=A0ABY2GQT8_9HYPO
MASPGMGYMRKPVPVRRRPVPAPGYDHQQDIYDLYTDEPPSPGVASLSTPVAVANPHAQQLRPSRSAAHLKQGPAAPHQAHHPSVARSPETTAEAFPAPVGVMAHEDLPPPPPYPGLSVSPAPEPLRRAQSTSALPLGAPPAGSSGPPSPGFSPHPQQAATLPVEEPKQQDSIWKSALGEAQYFASGLISHPSESTRHYSIIRHTRALIWYSGPSTSVSITVLSDEALPPTRTLWMQQKGYSGNMGMALKALAGTTSSWINVTPARLATVSDTPEADERSIQRDLKRFAKKASGRQKKHVPRETHIVRIPATASDGYFRLVLCGGSEAGKKVLCGSPVFRVASTSADVSVVRGASLSTMPLEMGVKVASTIGQAMANKYIGVASAVVNSQVGSIVANSTVKKVSTVAVRSYQVSGAGDAVQESWQRQRSQQERYDSLVVNVPVIHMVGAESGPEAPFPVKFDGKVVRGTGRSTAELGVPTANLSGVSDQVKLRMGGVFAAWARIQMPSINNDGEPDAAVDDMLPTDWVEAVVTIAPSRHAPPSVAMKNSVSVHIIHDFEETHFVDAKLKVLLMGFLHPAAPPHTPPDHLAAEHSRDMMNTLASLGRAAWGPHDTVAMMKSVKSSRSLGERLDETTGRVVAQVDKIPLHWAGVRSEVGVLRDKAYGNGGMWIVR